MKTRVREVTYQYGDGHQETWYYPQRTWFGFWIDFNRGYPLDGVECFNHKGFAELFLEDYLKRKITRKVK